MRSGAWVWVCVALVGCVPDGLRFDAPDALEFGDVPVTVEATQSLVITNLTELEGVVTLTAPDGFSVTPAIATLTSNARLAVLVRARPSDFGPREATLSINSSQASKQVTLRVRGTGPRIDVSDSISLAPAVVLEPATTASTRGVLRVGNVGTAGSTLKFFTPETDDLRLCIGPCGVNQQWSVSAGSFVELPVSLEVGAMENRSWNITLHTNDPIEPVKTVRVFVLIVRANPCMFGLNQVMAVSSNGAVLRLQHQGATPCFLRSMSLDVTPVRSLEFEADGFAFPRLVQPGEVITRRLKPSPSLVFQRGTLQIVFEGGQDSVLLEGTGHLDPCLTFLPTQLDFGTFAGANACATASKNVWVFNQCDEPVVLTDASTSSADFPLTLFTPNVELRAGGPPAVVSVRFMPRTTGSLSAALTIETSSSPIRVPLSGDALAQPRQVDRFRQDPLQNARTLFVIDTSASFAAELPRVRSELQSMLTELAPACAKLNVGFAPAEGAGPVALALNDAGSEWTSNQQPDFVGRALSAFDALPPSSETEACIGAAAQVFPNLPDAGFISGLCITDALEQTPDAGGALESLRTRGSALRWNVVTGTAASTCTVEAHDDDLLHQSLVSSTGGIRADVCSAFHTDFHTTPAGFPCVTRTVYFLSGVPNGTIEVRVDGQLVSSGWVFDSAQNSVNFDPASAPVLGTTVEISYDAPCTL
ncbi:MAG: choice-of-anchor D domain-containing protein [Archangium sp.]